MENLYEKYAVINSQIEALEKQKDEVRVKIQEEMTAKGEKKIETGVGSFSITKLKKWTYPERVIEIGEKFKEEKAKAESTGEATYVENDSLRFSKITF